MKKMIQTTSCNLISLMSNDENYDKNLQIFFENETILSHV